MKILWIIIFFTSLLGGNISKSNEEIRKEYEEQINYLKNHKNKK